MLLTSFSPSNRAIVRTALALAEKDLESTRKAMEKVELPIVSAQTQQGNLNTLKGLFADGDGKAAFQVRDIEIVHGLRLTLGMALRLLAAALEKKEDQLAELGVETENIEDRLDVVRHLVAEVGDQVRLELETSAPVAVEPEAAAPAGNGAGSGVRGKRRTRSASGDQPSAPAGGA